MDFAHDRFGRSGAVSVKLSLKPSEYIKRQVYATFINEPIFINTLGLYGAGQRDVVFGLPAHSRYLASLSTVH